MVIAFEELNAAGVIDFIAPHRLYAVPICDETGKTKTVLSVFDFMSWLTSFDDNKNVSSPGERWPMRLEILKERTVAGIKIHEGTIKDVINYAKPRDPGIMKLDDYAIKAAELFATGVKCILFLDHALCPQHILTQHDMCHFINDQLNTNKLCKDMAEYSLYGLELPYAEDYEVRTASMDINLRDAIKALKENGGALPLVDTQGKLVANFSTIDFKGILVENAPSFNQHAYRFLMNRSRHSLQPITLKVTDNILHASNLFFKYNLHHLWIVDDFAKPKRCFSMTDFINLAIHCKIGCINCEESTTTNTTTTTTETTRA